MPPTDMTTAIMQHLAWPAVALVALIVLRKHLVELARGAANIHELLGRSGDISSLVDRMGELKNEAAEIKEMIEAISIKDKGKELQELASASSATSSLSTDEMFEKISLAWASVKEVIQRKAKAAGVKSNMMGAKGVSATVDELVVQGAITKRAAELSIALSSQYQWMYRTSSPRSEWLNQQVFTSFLDGANQAKSALERINV